MKDKIILDLGCGTEKHPNSIGIDKAKLKNVDIISDLDFGIPIKNNSVDVIICLDFLEHADDLLHTIEEIHRALKHGGIVKIKVPFCRCFDAFVDPTHKNFFTERSFDYFTNNVNSSLSKLGYYSNVKFKVIKKKLILNPTILNKFLRLFLPKAILKRTFFDVYNQIEFELRKIRSKRQK